MINSSNPFALLVLAQQFANKTTKDMDMRLAFRQKLFELATGRKISRQEIWHLLIFVKYLTVMPDTYEQKYSVFTQQKLNLNPNSMGVSLDDIKWLDSLFEISTGDSVFRKLEEYKRKVELTEKQAKLAKEQLKKQAILADQQIKKGEQEARHFHATVSKCYYERKWSIEESADFFSISKENVEEIIQQKNH